MQRFWCSLLSLVALSSAQTLGFGVALSNTLELEPELTLSDLDVGDSDVTLRLAGGVAGPLELSLAARELQSFGPLGNLTFYSEVAFKGADFMAEVGAEGVIAQVAGQTKLGLTTLQPGDLDTAELYKPNPPRFYGSGFKFDASLSASYRLTRTLILTAAPEFIYTDSAAQKTGANVALETNARFVRLVDRDDAYLYVEGQLGVLQSNYAAFGLGYDLNRRGLPNVQGTAWLGLSADGVRPGGSLELSQSFKDLGARYSASLSAEPFRADVLPYRASLGYAQTFGKGEVQLEGYGTLDNTFSVPAFTTELSYSWTF